MAEQFYTILTNVGKAKIANAVALGTTVQISEVAVGDGGGTYYNPSETQTALVNELWRGPVSKVDVHPNNPNWIVVESVIPPDVGGFYIREVGIFDSAGDLIAVGKYPETYKPTFTSNNTSKDLIIRAILEVSNASVVELKVDPTVVIATQDYVNSAIQRPVWIGSTPPDNPIHGTVWHDTTTNPPTTKVWDSSTSTWVTSNADKCDGFDASQTPAPNTIPVSDSNGFLNSWIRQGQGSGLDADLVRGLPADFTANLSSAGYQKLPSGLIIQWGKVSIYIDSTGWHLVPVTFPLAFNSILSIVVSEEDYNPGSVEHTSLRFVNLSNSGLDISFRVMYIDIVGDIHFHWIAIGY